jgi:hypothetical protein
VVSKLEHLLQWEREVLAVLSRPDLPRGTQIGHQAQLRRVREDIEREIGSTEPAPATERVA